MTSKQAMLAITLVAVLLPQLPGCVDYRGASRRHQTNTAPYAERQVWAVAPLRNETGSQYADGVAFADDLTHRLTQTHGIDVLPVNRVLAAMQAMRLNAITSKDQALALRDALGVDGLVVGSLTAWDPYDPPKIGIAVELYVDPIHPSRSFDARQLTWAATEDGATPDRRYARDDQPVSTVAAYYDAADPVVRDHLDTFGEDRGKDDGKFDHQARLYRISMDLYSEFVSHMVCSRLLEAERVRTTRTEGTQQPQQPRQARLTQASP